MRHTIEYSKGPFAFLLLLLVVVGTIFLVGLAWLVHALWFAQPQAVKWSLLLIIVVLGGLVARMVAALASFSGSHHTIEADPQERIVRVVDTTITAACRKAIHFDDCCEIRCDVVPMKHGDPKYRLSIVRPDGEDQEIVLCDRLDDARDIAAPLAAEIGCPWYETPFPLAPPPTGLVVAIAIMGMLPVCLAMMFPMRANAPLGGPLERLAFVVVMLVPLMVVSMRTLSNPGFTVHVRTDPEGRVLRVFRRRGVFGRDTWNYPYDDIAEIVAEPGGADEPDGVAQPGKAAGRSASYGVRIVPREDVPRPDVPWDGLGGSAPPRDDTVFRTRDRDESRLTAERLARRIGRPWRDAT